MHKFKKIGKKLYFKLKVLTKVIFFLKQKHIREPTKTWGRGSVVKRSALLKAQPKI